MKRRALFTGLLLGLLYAAAPPAANAQDLPHDPELLNKMYRRDFDAIERSKAALINVLLVHMALAKTSCEVLGSVDPELRAAIKRHFALTASLITEHKDVILTAGFAQFTAPTTYLTAAWIDTYGCASERTQRLLRNLFRLSAARDTPGAWGL